MAESHREEIAKLEALYASNPGGRVFVHLAEAYRKGGEHERARRILDEGLARHSDSASGYVVLGRVLADMQVSDEAEGAFRKVLELDGGNLVALRWLGDLARQSGRPADAAAYYRDLLARNPSNEEVRDLVEIVDREASTVTAAGPESDEPVTEAFGESAEPTEEAAGDVEIAEPAVAPAAIEPVAASAPDEPSPTYEPAEPFATAEPEAFEPAAAEAVEPEPIAHAANPPVPEAYEGAAPAWAEPERAEPEASTYEPAALEPVAAEPVAPEPVAAEPVEPEPVVAEGDAPEPVAAEPVEAEPLVPEPYLPEFAAAPPEPDEEPVFAPFVEPPAEEPEPIASTDLEAPWPTEEFGDETAGPFEVQLFDSTIEVEEEEEDEVGTLDVDLTDLAEAAGDELEGEYADDEFLADFMLSAGEDDSVSEDSMDVLDTTSPLTLLDDEAATAEAPAGTASEEPFRFDLGGQEEGQGTGIDDLEFIEVVDIEEVPQEKETAAEYPFAAGGLSGLETPDDEAPIELIETFEVFELDEVESAEPAAPWGQPAEVAPPPPPPPARPQPVHAEAAPVTETMALLYRSQGFHDRAADVYRSLLAQRPGDERLTARLREAEEAAGIRPGTEEPVEDETGEVWLRDVGAAWPGDSPDTSEATPYAWTEAADEPTRSEPISSFLQDLVAWKQGQSRWFETAMLGLDGDDETESGAAPDDWRSAAETAPTDQPADPWLSSGGEVVRTWDPAQEMGFEVDEPAAEPTSAHVEQWEPDGFDAPTPGPAPSSAQSAPADQKNDDSEDEDVEMFRSWLQSLKK